MPTDNPKVSGYVPQAVYDRLIQFKDKQGVSVSQAVTIVLAEYFEIETEIDAPVPVGGVTLARMEALEHQVSELWKAVSIDSAPSQSDGSSVENCLKIPLQKNQTDLAKYLGINKATLSKRTKSNSPEELLQYTRSKAPDSLGWFFLPSEKVYEQESRSEGGLQGGLPL